MTEKVFRMEMGQQSRHQHTITFMGPSALSLSGPLYLLTGLQTLKVSEINDMSHSFSPSYYGG